jgi:hypothetical protein
MTVFVLLAIPVVCFTGMVGIACCVMAGRADSLLEQQEGTLERDPQGAPGSLTARGATPYTDGSTDELSRSLDVIADLAAAPSLHDDAA